MGERDSIKVDSKNISLFYKIDIKKDNGLKCKQE